MKLSLIPLILMLLLSHSVLAEPCGPDPGGPGDPNGPGGPEGPGGPIDGCNSNLDYEAQDITVNTNTTTDIIIGDNEVLVTGTISNPEYINTSQPDRGYVGNNNDGTFTFQPHTYFDDLPAGQTRVVSFTFNVAESGTDDGGDEGLVTLNVTNQAIPPAPFSARDISVSTRSDQAIIIGDDASEILLQGSAGSPSYSLVAQPAKGLVSDNSNGTFTFTPGLAFALLVEGQSEQVTFQYQITADGHTDTGLLTVTVTGKPTPEPEPLFAANNVTVTTSELATISIDGDETLLLGEADDAVYRITQQPSKGSVSLTNATFEFNPNNAFDSLLTGQQESVTIGYSISKGGDEEEEGLSVSSTVNGIITVTVTGTSDNNVAVSSATIESVNTLSNYQYATNKDGIKVRVLLQDLSVGDQVKFSDLPDDLTLVSTHSAVGLADDYKGAISGSVLTDINNGVKLSEQVNDKVWLDVLFQYSAIAENVTSAQSLTVRLLDVNGMQLSSQDVQLPKRVTRQLAIKMHHVRDNKYALSYVLKNAELAEGDKIILLLGTADSQLNCTGMYSNDDFSRIGDDRPVISCTNSGFRVEIAGQLVQQNELGYLTFDLPQLADSSNIEWRVLASIESATGDVSNIEHDGNILLNENIELLIYGHEGTSDDSSDSEDFSYGISVPEGWSKAITIYFRAHILGDFSCPEGGILNATVEGVIHRCTGRSIYTFIPEDIVINQADKLAKLRVLYVRNSHHSDGGKTAKHYLDIAWQISSAGINQGQQRVKVDQHRSLGLVVAIMSMLMAVFYFRRKGQL